MKKDNMIDGDVFARLAKKYNLYYVATHEIKEHLETIKNLPGRVNVLSANSDGGIPKPGNTVNWFDFVWDNIPSNVNVWFAQNADVYDARIVPIPIGLECDRWHAPSKKKDAMLSVGNVSRDKLIYLNHTTRNDARWYCYNEYENKSWVTVEKMDKDFNHYFKQLAQHKFTFSPDGNGYDCCRTWEALYMGCIPIVQRHRFTEEFSEKLPILVVDDYTNITEDWLNEKYVKLYGQFDWHALTVEYWDNLISEAIK